MINPDRMRCIRSGVKVYEAESGDKNVTKFIRFTYDVDRYVTPNIDYNFGIVCMQLVRTEYDGLQGQSYRDCIPGKSECIHVTFSFGKLPLLYDDPQQIWNEFCNDDKD